jgi:hypothetical protein
MRQNSIFKAGFNAANHNVHPSANIMKLIKSKGMRLVGYIACTQN